LLFAARAIIEAKTAVNVIITKGIVHDVSVLVVVSTLVRLLVVVSVVVFVYSKIIFFGTLIERDLLVDKPLF
jgi:hypothetical protein